MLHSLNLIEFGKEMHHCASITRDNNGFWLTNYHGAECTDSQRVVVSYAYEPGKLEYNVDLGNKTGNPIVWTFKGQVYLMYSLFTDSDINGTKIDYGLNTVNRWKNCDNYLAKLSYVNGSIKIEELGKIEGAYGLLARCQPLVEKDRVIIPLYREEDPLCHVWIYNDNGLSKLSEFGEMTSSLYDKLDMIGMKTGSLGNGVAIQPSIIYSGDSYYAFCRNVCRPVDKESEKKFSAWVFQSKGCVKWEEAQLSTIPNHNNSLVVSNRKDDDGFVVYSSNRSRSNMFLHHFKSRIAINLGVVIKRQRSSFSYPNMMWDNGALHVVHTNCGLIAWHYFDEKFITETFGE